MFAEARRAETGAGLSAAAADLAHRPAVPARRGRVGAAGGGPLSHVAKVPGAEMVGQVGLATADVTRWSAGHSPI